VTGPAHSAAPGLRPLRAPVGGLLLPHLSDVPDLPTLAARPHRPVAARPAPQPALPTQPVASPAPATPAPTHPARKPRPRPKPVVIVGSG